MTPTEKLLAHWSAGCLCAMYRETRDVEKTLDWFQWSLKGGENTPRKTAKRVLLAVVEYLDEMPMVHWYLQGSLAHYIEHFAKNIPEFVDRWFKDRHQCFVDRCEVCERNYQHLKATDGFCKI